MRKAAGQCSASARRSGRKILPQRGSYCRDRGVPGRREESPILLGFSRWHGACSSCRHELCRPRQRHCRSSAMLFALGAASSASDALQSLTSSKSSSSQSTGVTRKPPQTRSISLSSSSATESAASSTGCGSGCSQISPETMSALLAAQSQSSTGIDRLRRPTEPLGALKELFSQIDANGDGKISKRNLKTRLAPAAPTSRRPTTCSPSSTRTVTARSASTKCRRRCRARQAVTTIITSPVRGGSDGAGGGSNGSAIRWRRRCRAHPRHRSPTATARPRHP